MPNGGPDNCGTCGFNRRNGGVWRNPAPDESQMPFGPVYASGLYDQGYRRIPWHGAIEPEHIGPGVCGECRARFADGIGVAGVERAALEFCGNLHYLQWWKRAHPGEDAPMSAGNWEHPHARLPRRPP